MQKLKSFFWEIWQFILAIFEGIEDSITIWLGDYTNRTIIARTLSAFVLLVIMPLAIFLLGWMIWLIA